MGKTRHRTSYLTAGRVTGRKHCEQEKEKGQTKLSLMDLNIRTLILLKGEKCEDLKWEMLLSAEDGICGNPNSP